MSKLDWQDLHYFSVLARCGSLSATARELKVDHATVGRRVASLETALGARLIDRLPRSCPLTAEGAEIARMALDIEELAQAVERRARGASALRGPVRVSAPPGLAATCIAPHVATLRAAHPEIRLVLQATPTIAALNEGQADIALRLTRPTESGAKARRIGSMRFALYAHQSYARRPAETWEFVTFDEALSHIPQQRWLRNIMAGRKVAFEASDLFGQLAAVQSGAGVAALPCIMADHATGLVRLDHLPQPPDLDVWLIVYPEVGKSPAVREVMNFLIACVSRDLPKS